MWSTFVQSTEFSASGAGSVLRGRHASISVSCIHDHPGACPDCVSVSSPTHKELFVDTNLANEAIVGNEKKPFSGPSIVTAAARDAPRTFPNCTPASQQFITRTCHTSNSSGCCQMAASSPVRLCRSSATSSARFNRAGMHKSHLQHSFDSGLDSPFSNCAILIKEVSEHFILSFLTSECPGMI
ncbi:hypothetical protein Tcan_16899 [Toxocara canis]|uniref:Uncharacterized protein n=1 Tax=Toxocara canis TaxID=6265 RepID=A0A0B2W3J5_TOXCA|nr:hypothetical protein Tcan_16899 [Toxocara canis]